MNFSAQDLADGCKKLRLGSTGGHADNGLDLSFKSREDDIDEDGENGEIAVEDATVEESSGNKARRRKPLAPQWLGAAAGFAGGDVEEDDGEDQERPQVKNK